GISSSRSLIRERQSSRSIRAPEADLSANPAKYRRTVRTAQVLQRSELVGGESTRLARGKRAEAEWSEAHATQAQHGMIEGRAVALHFAVASLGERELDPRGLGRPSEPPHPRGHAGTIPPPHPPPPPPPP